MTNDFKPAKAGGNQPRLSKEEYAEKKRAEKEKVYQMIDDAAREIVSDPEKFKSFLDTQSRMDRYSAANALLIYSQYPQATQLKDFDDWGKDNVKITKGAKSICCGISVHSTLRIKKALELLRVTHNLTGSIINHLIDFFFFCSLLFCILLFG